MAAFTAQLPALRPTVLSQRSFADSASRAERRVGKTADCLCKRGSRELHYQRCRNSTLSAKQNRQLVQPQSSIPRAAVASSRSETAIVSPQTEEGAPLQLTYLEGNSWMFEIAGISILLDPILGFPLDFDIPWLYSANKKVMRDKTTEDIPEFEYLLITQGFDDHCHLKTLRPLAARRPDLPVIASPNAQGMMGDLFKNVTYLEPGESTTVRGANGVELSIKATAGPVLGPPWQRPENGYIFRAGNPSVSLYLEPHCVYDPEVAKEAPVDVVVTPVVKQQLPAFTLVSGQEDAVKLVKLLQAKYVIPMANAELDAEGLLSKLVQPQGTVESFEAMLRKELPGVRLLYPTPNEPLSIPL